MSEGQDIPRKTLTDRHGATFAFDAGALALDFAYTGGSGQYAVYESFFRPSDLDHWLLTAGLIDQHAAAATSGQLVRAVEFRTAAWEVMTAKATAQPLPTAGLRVLNNTAAAQSLVPELSSSGHRRWRKPDVPAALSHLARQTIDLVAADDGRLRQCAASDCPLLFVDTSRGGRRRWCSMQRCGNRHKVKDFRARNVL